MDEREARVKFMRGLNKVANAAFSALKKAEFDAEKFAAAMQKHGKFLARLEPVFLDRPYNKKLLEFVNLCLTSTDKDALQSAANELDKLKNSTTYKRKKRPSE